MPEGSPALVEPKLDKVDISRLSADSKKYEAAGVFDEAAALWWTTFTESFNESYGCLPEDPPNWLLDLLVPAEATAPERVHIPPRIAQLYQAEKAAQPKV